MAKCPAAGVSGCKDCGEADDAQRAFSKTAGRMHSPAKSLASSFLNQRCPSILSLFWNLICITMFILMCPTFVQQQARAQMDACMCFREKRTVPWRWTDPDCPHDFKALKQLWTHIHVGEGTVPHEINTDKCRKEPSVLTKRLRRNPNVGTDLDDSWKSLRVG